MGLIGSIAENRRRPHVGLTSTDARRGQIQAKHRHTPRADLDDERIKDAHESSWPSGSHPDFRGSSYLRTPQTRKRCERSYNGAVIRNISLLIVAMLATANGFGQTPQPFPRPGEPVQPQRPAVPVAPPPAQTPAAPRTPTPAPQPQQADLTLGVPVYPSAQMIASYDAGRGQRYVVYGATSPFAEIVTYYRTQLDERGSLVFKEPPTHMFEVGRFREETMAFPPGVTVKDWTWGGSQGYPNPKLGGQPARFPTIIVIATPPAGVPTK